MKSTLALLFSIAALAICLIRFQPLSFDWAVLLVTSLGALATVLVGWQIYNVITFDKQISKLRGEFKEIAIKAADDMVYKITAIAALSNVDDINEHNSKDKIDLLITALKFANEIVNDEDNLRGQIIEKISSVASPVAMTQEQKLKLVKTMFEIPEPKPEKTSEIYESLFAFPVVYEGNE